MKEINFENEVPPQIAELEGRIVSSGAFAHRGVSGKRYKIGDLVEVGALKRDGKELSTFIAGFYRMPKHTHEETIYSRDGVSVETRPLTVEEIKMVF